MNSDYKKAYSDFESILKDNNEIEMIHDEILFLSLYLLNDDGLTKKISDQFISINPEPEDYLILADLTFKNREYSKALMLLFSGFKIK